MGMLGLCCSVNSLKVDEAEKAIDVIFLHFFVLEFVLRVIALGGVDTVDGQILHHQGWWLSHYL